MFHNRTLRTAVFASLVLITISGTAVACTQEEFNQEPLGSDKTIADSDCAQVAYDEWVSTHGYEATRDIHGNVHFIPDPDGFADYNSAIMDCQQFDSLSLHVTP